MIHQLKPDFIHTARAVRRQTEREIMALGKGKPTKLIGIRRSRLFRLYLRQINS
jgi:cob(I)alamin adenosyltransferase